MNKSQLVDALADRLGDRRTAASAVDSLFQIVVDTVRSGDSVSIAGFGVFESRARAARTGRNPRTGETVDVPATTVPAFRPGTGFRSAVADEHAPAAAAPEAPRRRRPAATNGASADGNGRAVNGATEVAAPETATLLATAPVAEAAQAKGKKKEKPAKAAAKVTGKDSGKVSGKDKDKARKKGKKGK
jgi:DNA-binding protein HU-beta